jgi:general secretion pathway protein E
MGVERFLLAATLRLVVGQRLARMTCRECDGFGNHEGIQCKSCRGTGYAGRSVVAEVLEADAGLRELIGRGETMSVLRGYAVSRGFHPMSDDAGEKGRLGSDDREKRR